MLAIILIMIVIEGEKNKTIEGPVIVIKIKTSKIK